MRLRLSLFLLCLIPTAAIASDWPQWRGPGMNGVSSATGLPAKWSPGSNIVWQIDLPAWSGGTPVIHGDYIFLTSPSVSAKAEASAEPEQSVGKPDVLRSRNRLECR